jgi:hypothetical protein
MPAVQQTVTLMDAFMKEIYPDWKLHQLMTRKRAFLKWVPMKGDFDGDAYVVPVYYEDPQSVYNTLANAVTHAETSQSKKFVISARKKLYGEVQIEAEALMASKSKRGAFISARTTEIDGILRQLGKRLHTDLLRAGTGSIGRAKTITKDNPAAGSSRILLYNKSDVYNFGNGMVLEANNTDNATTPKTNDEVIKVIAVNAADGHIFVSEDVIDDLSTTAWADDDFLFPVDQYDSTISGVGKWLPLSAPTSGDSHFTVDRSVSVEALAGHRVDDTSRSVLVNAQELAMRVAEFGGDPETLFLNPRAGLQLQEEAGTKVERLEPGMAQLGFDGFRIHSFVTGPINVVFDICVPADRGYLLQRDTWRFAHLGPVPHIIADDGKQSQRKEDGTYDGIAVRARLFGELVCNAPGYNGVMSVAVAS